jgi:pimeloyl-ACP methyl ester carboxylesterase
MTKIFKTEAGRQAVRESYAGFLAQWPVASTQQHVKTRFGETFVVASGPEGAPPILLLHGSASNSAMWLADVATWADRFRVYAIDIIGEPGFSSENRPTLASGAYTEWLDDVFAGLELTRAAMLGVSLGGWLAADYATRRPEQIGALVVLAPGGIGRHKNILIWALPLLFLGAWGRRRLIQRITGVREESPEADAVGKYMSLIFTHFRPRTEALPPVRDDALRRLTMPVLAILGGRDVFIDSAQTRERIQRHVSHARVIYLPEAGHFLPGHAAEIAEFVSTAMLT